MGNYSSSNSVAPDILFCNELLNVETMRNVPPSSGGKYYDTFGSASMNICLTLANQSITPTLAWALGKDVYKGVVSGSYPPPSASNVLPPDFPPLVTAELQSDVVTVIVAFVALLLFFIVTIAAIIMFFIGLTGKVAIRNLVIGFVVIVVLAVVFAVFMYWLARTRLFPVLSNYGQRLEEPLSIYASQLSKTVLNYLFRVWNKGLKNAANYLIGEGTTDYNTALCTGSNVGVPNIVSKLTKITNLTYCPNSCGMEPLTAWQMKQDSAGTITNGIVFSASLEDTPDEIVLGCFGFSSFAGIQFTDPFTGKQDTLDGQCGIPETVQPYAPIKVSSSIAGCVPPCPAAKPCSTGQFDPYQTSCNLNSIQKLQPTSTQTIDVPQGKSVVFTWYIKDAPLDYSPSQPLDGFIANSGDSNIIYLFDKFSTSFLPSPIFPNTPTGCVTVTPTQSALYTLFIRNASADVGLAGFAQVFDFHGLVDYSRMSIWVNVVAPSG